MTLRKRWRGLDRSTVGAAPDRYGYYELGDDDGDVIGRDWGVLQDELKEVLAYGDAAQVRWQVAEHREHAKDLFEEHGD
ncbi:hypothetical protein BRC81_04540 [Halobacteriales archaeon QS_1_68_20]|nr:MAG: hypothetical protein BRC81_04540 [Halobacteriales archaeon QS_1_68_20]